jgi:hypothetical protein
MGAWNIFSSLRGSTVRGPRRRAVAGLAPDPATTPEPVVQVYGARCQGLLGLLGMHTWIAVKRRGASGFTLYEVVGGRPWLRGPVLAIRRGPPDATSWGKAPRLLADKRGEGVDALISRIEAVVRDYPYGGEYVAWPGPNSNTFVAHVARAIPELGVDLPPTAIGKDYLGDRFAPTAPSGRGFQLSLLRLLGFLASLVERFEINVLGKIRSSDIEITARVFVLFGGGVLFLRTLCGMVAILAFGFGSAPETTTALSLTLAFPIYLIGLKSLRTATCVLWVFFVAQWIVECFISHPLTIVSPLGWWQADTLFVSIVLVHLGHRMLARTSKADSNDLVDLFLKNILTSD